MASSRPRRSIAGVTMGCVVCFCLFIGGMWCRSFWKSDTLQMRMGRSGRLCISSIVGSLAICHYVHSEDTAWTITLHSADVASVQRDLDFVPPEFKVPWRGYQPWIEWKSGSIEDGSSFYRGHGVIVRHSIIVFAAVFVLLVNVIVAILLGRSKVRNGDAASFWRRGG